MATVTLANTPLSQRTIDYAPWGSIGWPDAHGFGDYAGTEPPISDQWKAGKINAWRFSHGWGAGVPESGRNNRRLDQHVQAYVFAHYDLTGPATDASSYVLKAGSQPPAVNMNLATITSGTPPAGSQVAYGVRADPVSHVNAIRFLADPSYRLLTNVGTPSGVQVPENILQAMPAIRVAQIEIGNEPGAHEGFQNYQSTATGSANVFPRTVLDVASTTGSPAAPSSVQFGSAVFNYTGKSATQFTGVTTTFTGTIPAGSIIKRANTQTSWINNWKWYCTHYYYYWRACYEAIEAGWGSWWPTSWGWPRFQGFTNVEANNITYTDTFLAEYFPAQPAGLHQLNEHHLPYWLEATPYTTAGGADPGGGNPLILAPGAAGSSVRIIDILDARLQPDGSPETNTNVVKGMVGYHRYGGPANTDGAISYVGTGTADEGQTPVGANNQLAHAGKIDTIRTILDGKGAAGVGIVCNEGQHNVSFKGDQTVDGRASYTYLLDIILNLNRWDRTGQMYQYHVTGFDSQAPPSTFRRGWGAFDFSFHTIAMVMRDMVAPIGKVPLLAGVGTRGVSVSDRIACAWTKSADGLTGHVLAVNLDLPVSAAGGPASAAHAHTFNVPQNMTGNITRTSLLQTAATPIAPTVSTIASGNDATWTDTLQIGEIVYYRVQFAAALPGDDEEPPPPPPASFTFAGRFSVARRVSITPPGLDGTRALPRQLGILNINEGLSSDTVIPGTGGLTLRDVPSDTMIGGVQLRDTPMSRILPPPPEDT